MTFIKHPISLFFLALGSVLAEPSSAPKGLKDAPADVKISFQGLGDKPRKDVAVLGTLFRTKTGDRINFIPVDSSASGVWTKNYTKEVATAALAKIKPGAHVPVLVVCDTSTTQGKPPQGRPPGVATGVFRGPIHTAAIREVTYLSMKEAEAFANNHIEDEAQRSRFLSRIGAAQPSPFPDPEESR